MRAVSGTWSLIPLVVAGACGGAPDPIDGIPLVVEEVVDLGVLPLPPKAVGRDGGLSGIVGGKLLWTFGDTFLSEPSALDGSHVISATASWATLAEPLVVTHAVDGDEPAQVIPYTPAELAQNQAAPLDGYSLWPGPPLDVGEATALVAFQRIKRMEGGGFVTEGTGTARIAADATVAVRAPALLFEGADRFFVPTIALDGYVYAFGCEQRGFLDFGCQLARAPREVAEDRAAYTFFDGDDWVASRAAAVVVIDQTSVAPSVTYSAHLGRYLAVNCKLISSTILLRTAPRIEGPWTEPVEIVADGVGILPPTDPNAFNYQCGEHAVLADANTIVIGYSRPTEPFRGDVRLARVTLR